MKILAIDTASDVCGVSILEDNHCICKLDTNTGRTHSENLMPMIQEAFQKTGLTLKNIDLLVCDKGPGSFTGIRIGIATIKAFCDSLAIPCVGISSLEVLAYQVKEEGFIASILDCKNENCYYALYELKNGIYHEIISPVADSVKNAISILQTYDSPITFVGDGIDTYASIILEKIPMPFLMIDSATLDSFDLGLAGLTKFHTLGNVGEDVLPLYLKKPQAQRLLEEKLRKEHLNHE